MWVVRPAPSVPSSTISQPLNSSSETFGTPSPYHWKRDTVRLPSGLGLPLARPLGQRRRHLLAQLPLLRLNGEGRVHHVESELAHHLLVLDQDEGLEPLVGL